MLILWTYLRPHWRLGALALLLAAASQVLALIDPIIFGIIIDRHALPSASVQDGDARMAGVLRLLLLALAIALLSRLAKALQDYVMRLLVQKLGTQMFNDGLRHLLRLAFQELEEVRSGEMLSLLQKVRADCERLINAFFNTAFAAAVGIAFLTWYAVARHWLLVPVFLVGVLVMGGLTGILSREIKSQQRSIVRDTNRNSGFITESLRNIELIKSLGLTFPEIRRLQAQTDAIFALEMRKVKRIRVLAFLQGSTLSVLKLSVLFALLWLIFHDVLSTGELIAMQFMSVAIFAPLQELGNVILAYREAQASIANFAELLQRPIERRPLAPVDIGPVTTVRFEQVSFRHKGAAEDALADISFKASLGETVAFVGPSGSGKSTLVKLLVGLYPPACGAVYYNDIATSDFRYNMVRRQIGLVTQETNLFAGSLRDNVRYVKPDATDAEIVESMEQAACAYLIARAPDGLDTLIGERGMKLSGGERQRLSIARALIRKPPLLIFDEATSALDSLTEEQISTTVRALSARQSRMTLLIAHRLSTVLHADTIFVLEKGRIVEQGNHAALLAARGLYCAMWRQQVGERAGAPQERELAEKP